MATPIASLKFEGDKFKHFFGSFKFITYQTCATAKTSIQDLDLDPVLDVILSYEFEASF